MNRWMARRARGGKLGKAGATVAPWALGVRRDWPRRDARPAQPKTFPALPRKRRRVSRRAYSALSAAGIGRSMIGGASSVSVQQGCCFKSSLLVGSFVGADLCVRAGLSNDLGGHGGRPLKISTYGGTQPRAAVPHKYSLVH